MAEATILVVIDGDAGPLSATLNQAATAVKGFEGTTNQAVAATQQATQKMGGAFSSVSSTLKTLAPAFIAIGAAAVAGVTKGIGATQQWASDTRTLQRVTGQTAEGASALLGAASELGLGVDKLSTGFGILAKNVANSSPALEKYGLDVRDAQGQTLPFDDILGEVIDKFATLPEGPEQAAFAMNVFGRSGKELIPILSRGRDGLAELESKARDLGLVMSQDDVDASKSLTLAQHQLGDAIKGAYMSLGKLFIPALTKVAQVATQAVEFITRLPAPVKEFGVGLSIAAGFVGTLTVAMNGLKSTFGPVIGGITSFGKALVETGIFQNASAAITTVSSAVEAVGSEVSKQSENIKSASDTTSQALADVSAGSTLAANAVVASATRSASATSGAAAVAATEAENVGGFFARLAAGASSVGESLSGIGSSIAAALTSPAAIIAGIVAAIVGLTVIIVKNWNTIKGWANAVGQAFGPGLNKIGQALNEVGAAFAKVRTAFGDFVHALGDAFGAIGDAFGQVLQALQPFEPALAAIGKLFALIAAGPFLGFLKLVTVGLQALAWGLTQGAKALEGFSRFMEGLAQIIGPVINQAINLAIDGINALIAGWNKLLPVINTVLQTDFDHIDALDHVAYSSGQAADATDAYGSSAATATGHLKGLSDTSNDAASKMGGLSSAAQKAAPLLRAMGTSFSDIKAAATEAFNSVEVNADDAAGTVAAQTAAMQKFADDQIAAAQQVRSAFEDQARSSLSFAQSMLSNLESVATQAQDTLAGDTSNLGDNALAKLREQAHLTAQDILDTFKTAATQSRHFGQDLLEIARIGGKAGKDLASSLLQAGDVLGAQLIADAPAKLQQQIVTAFGKSENAANTFASKLTNAIVGPLKDIRTIMEAIAQHFGITLDLNDHGAQGKADHVKDTLDGLSESTYRSRFDLDTNDAENRQRELRGHLAQLDRHKFKSSIDLDTVSAERKQQALYRDLERVQRKNWLAHLGVTVEDAEKLDALRDKIMNLVTAGGTGKAGSRYQVDVAVHTAPVSPWPDEAIRDRVINPLAGFGFQRRGGTWTLPLLVSLHTDDGAAGDIRKLENLKLDNKTLHVRVQADLDSLRKLEHLDLKPKTQRVLVRADLSTLHQLERLKLANKVLPVVVRASSAFAELARLDRYRIDPKTLRIDVKTDTAALVRLEKLKLDPKTVWVHVRADTKAAWDAIKKFPETIPTTVDVDADKATDTLHAVATYPLKDLSLRVLATAEQAWNVIRTLRDYQIPDKTFDVIIHTRAGSPWPDEAIKQHLTDPMAKQGFKKVGDRWTLPLDVAMHTDTATVTAATTDATTDPVTGPAKTSAVNLHRLIQVEVDNRGILRDIRNSLKHMDAATGSKPRGGDGGSVSGSLSGGGGGNLSSSLGDAVHRVVKLLEKSGLSANASVDVVRHVSEQGSDNIFIKKSVAMVADELGKNTAKLYSRALQRLDDATLHSDAKRAALIKQALEATRSLEEQRQQRRDATLQIAAHALKNVPRLPAGRTNVDPNLHHRLNRLHVSLDREHFDKQLDYENTYGRGY